MKRRNPPERDCAAAIVIGMSDNHFFNYDIAVVIDSASYQDACTWGGRINAETIDSKVFDYFYLRTYDIFNFSFTALNVQRDETPAVAET